MKQIPLEYQTAALLLWKCILLRNLISITLQFYFSLVISSTLCQGQFHFHKKDKSFPFHFQTNIQIFQILQLRQQHTTNVFKTEPYIHQILFFLHGTIPEQSFSLWFPGERTPFVIQGAPSNGSNIEIKWKQMIKKCLKNYPIMKIYFQIIFKFTWTCFFCFDYRNFQGFSCFYRQCLPVCGLAPTVCIIS